MEMIMAKQYLVRYLTEDEGVMAMFLGDLPEKFAVEIAAGNLFVMGWCPGNPWCLYTVTNTPSNDEEIPVKLDGDGEPLTIPGYGHKPELWEARTTFC